MPKSRSKPAQKKGDAKRPHPVDEDALIDEAIRLAKDEALRIASETAAREAAVLEESRRKAMAVLGEPVAEEHLASKAVMRPPTAPRK